MAGGVKAISKPDTKLLFDTNFDTGPSGFVQLIDDVRPMGTLQLDSDYVYPGSRHSLLLATEDVSWALSGSATNWGQATAIHRRGRADTLGLVKFDVWFGFTGQVDLNRPRAIRFGIDQAHANGDRRYFMFQYVNWDDNDLTGSSSGTLVRKWQVLVYDPDNPGTEKKKFVDVPDGDAFPIGENEHKRNMHHVEMLFDIDAGHYVGLRFDGSAPWGGRLEDGKEGAAPVALADEDNPLVELGQPWLESLPLFAGGFNFSIDLVNRLNVQNTKAWLVVGRARAEYI